MSQPVQSWPRWWTKQKRLHALSSTENDVLGVLAAHVNRDGETFISDAAIADAVCKSERQVQRMIASLKKRGLVSVEPRGRETALRRLHDVVPAEQLTLESTASDVRPDTRPDTRPDIRDVRPDTRPDISGSLSRHPGCRTEVKEEDYNDDERGAREATADGKVLAPTLPRVVAILEDVVPAIEVYEPSLNATLLRFPESKGYDHEQAAYGVVGYVQQPGVTGPHNPVGLLSKEFEFQARRRARAAEDADRRDRDHAARRDAGRPPLHALPGGRSSSRRDADAPLEPIDEQAIYARSAAAVQGVADPWSWDTAS